MKPRLIILLATQENPLSLDRIAAHEQLITLCMRFPRNEDEIRMECRRL